MSFTLETEYVSADELNLVKCKFCNRKFFTTSYEKHISSCEKEWVRSNCREERKSSKESGPYVKAHVTGYEVQVKTFADMLSLGAERRRRWRLRHQEFIHTIKAAKTNCHINSSDKSDFFYELDSKITHAGLTQCEYCKRRFNDAAYFRHMEQCKARQTDAKVQLTEEQKEAKERFVRRMKYNTKLVSKERPGLEFCDSEEQINRGDTSGNNETYFNQQQSELIDKLSEQLYSELRVLQSPTTEILQAKMLKKILKNNITSLADAPSQITASPPCFSKSNPAATSCTVLTDKSYSHEELKPSSSKFKKHSNVQFSGGEHFQNGGIGFLQSNDISHYSHSSLKSPTTAIDNDLIKDIGNENTCKLDQDDIVSTKRKNKVKPETKVKIEDAEKSVSQHHGRQKSPGAKKDSAILYYNYNESISKFSPGRINLNRKYQLRMNTPSKKQTTGEGSLIESSLKLVPHDEVCQRTGGIHNQFLYLPKSQESDITFLSSLHSPGVHSSGTSDTLKESQSRNIETTGHHSGNYQRVHHHKHLDKPEISSNTPSSNPDYLSQIGKTITNPKGSSKKSKSRYCPHCGEKFAPDARFCSSCGAIRKSKVTGGQDAMTTSVSQQMSKLT